MKRMWKCSSVCHVPSRLAVLCLQAALYRKRLQYS